MADLSQLSDEQLQVYKEMLEKGNGSPPTAQSEPGFIEKARRFMSSDPEQRKQQQVFPIPGFSDTSGVTKFFNAPFAGHEQMIQGAKNLFTPGKRQEGAADLIEGGASQLTPWAPRALANPVGAAVGAATGYGLQKGTQAIARMTGMSPETERLAGDVVPLIAGPSATKAVGRGIQKMAEPMFRAGYRIPAKDYQYGANPAEAGLRLTTGNTPEEIETSAQAAKDRILAERNAAHVAAGNAGVRVPVQPARNVIGDIITRQQGERNLPADELIPIKEHLENPQPNWKGQTVQPPAPMIPQASKILGPNGQPVITMVPGPKPPARIADYQTPMDYQGLKQGLADEFTDFKNELNQKPVRSAAANAVHHQMGEDLETAVPGTAAKNRDIQSLIPLQDRSRLLQYQQGGMENWIDRARRQTGALLGPLFGYSVGGPVGAAGMTAAQEFLSSPSALIRTSRKMYGAGKDTQSPIASGASRVAPLINMEPPYRAPVKEKKEK